MENREQVMAPARGIGVFEVLNLAVLIGAYVVFIIRASGSRWSAVTIAAGGAFVCAIALLTLARRPREQWLRVPASAGLRTLLAVAPWAALLTLIALRGLWWIQRPVALRFFALYAFANWSAVWCLTGTAVRLWSSGSARAVINLALAIGALGIQGAAFGFMPFGCALASAMGALAAFALAAACFGERPAHLRLFAASLATAVAVAAVEATVRLLDVGHNVQEADSREYAREFYSLTPPRSAFVNEPKALDEFPPALIEINSLGIRGPELTDPHADLLLLGDSMIEARQLPWPQTLGPQLQEAVRARGLSLRVVAHGMRGWSPLLEWNWYLKIGRTLAPKAVMLFFFWNDLWTAGSEAATFNARLRADGRPLGFDVPIDSKWIWYKHVRVVRLVGDAWHRLGMAEVRQAFTTMVARKGSERALDDAGADRLARRLAAPPLSSAELGALLSAPEAALDPKLRSMSQTSLWPGLRPLELWTERQRAAAARTELELQRFAEDVAHDGGRLVLVYVPNPLQIGPTECGIGRLFEQVDTNVVLPPESGIQTWVRGVSERHGIELLDPSTAMRDFERTRSKDSMPLYLRADCHWSERGHRFMAEYLAEWCQRNMPQR